MAIVTNMLAADGLCDRCMGMGEGRYYIDDKNSARQCVVVVVRLAFDCEEGNELRI